VQEPKNFYEPLHANLLINASANKRAIITMLSHASDFISATFMSLSLLCRPSSRATHHSCGFIWAFIVAKMSLFYAKLKIMS
jgi:hypothetical protein